MIQPNKLNNNKINPNVTASGLKFSLNKQILATESICKPPIIALAVPAVAWCFNKALAVVKGKIIPIPILKINIGIIILSDWRTCIVAKKNIIAELHIIIENPADIGW